MNYRKYFTKLYPILRYILCIHLLALAILSFLRLILLLTNLQNAENIETSLISNAFHLGVFFDNIEVSIITAVSILGAVCIAFLDSSNSTFRKLFNCYYIIVYTILLGFSVADIPYFNYFFRHLDVGIVDWLSHDTEGFSMVFTESSYYKYYLLFFVIIISFSFCVILLGRQWSNYNNHLEGHSKFSVIKFSLVSLILATISYTGITRKYDVVHPILLWTAYLSPSSFANELTTSPIYNTLASIVTPKYKDKEVNNVISVEDAFALLKKDFSSKVFIPDVSPVCRKITPRGKERRANIVIVLMESMSAYYLNEKPQLTPFLNELKNKSYYFENFYSPGTHTNQGIFASLYGIPGLFDRVIMDDRVIGGSDRLPLCEGLPINLNTKGYTSSFFLSHDKSYNNTDMFLYKNGYDLKNIYSKENYPESEYVNYWGVSDGYLLDYAAKTFNKEKEKPFFGTIMTITNHPEYVVPESFKSVSTDASEQAVYYADYCIKKFLEDASKQEWYSNTIFVFLGDHGKILGKQEFEIPTSLNHIPLMIYSPLFTDMPKTFKNFGTQIDIFPTLIGLLNIEYENNSLGIDLLKEKHPYAVFTTDEKLGCINERYLYCYNTLSKQEVMYDYKKNDLTNLATVKKAAFDSIRNYAAATVQTTNYLLKNGLTRRKK